uniref:Uncharacterized protein n=1 Tax=Oryzias latipes TaxID=8090 RepID=A0A3B3HZ43_ORYLA
MNFEWTEKIFCNTDFLLCASFPHSALFSIFLPFRLQFGSPGSTSSWGFASLPLRAQHLQTHDVCKQPSRSQCARKSWEAHIRALSSRDWA